MNRLLCLVKNTRLRTIVLDACHKVGFVPKFGFEGDETDTIRGFVAAGLGVSLLPEMAITESGQLQPVKIRVTDPKVTRTIGLICRKDVKIPPVAEVFQTFSI